jgi:MFS family permease
MMLARSLVADSPHRADHVADLSAVSSLAFVIGPLIGGVLGEHVGQNACFLLATMLLLVAALLTSMASLHAAVPDGMPAPSSPLPAAPSETLELRVLLLVALTVLSTCANSIHSSTYMVHARDLGAGVGDMV